MMELYTSASCSSSPGYLAPLPTLENDFLLLNGSGTVPARSAGSAALIWSVYWVVCVLGLSGNSMVIYVMFRFSRMRTATNLYLLNLAVSDELLMLSVPFAAAAAPLRRWPLGAALCRLVLNVDAVNMFTSIYGLTVLSVDRYVALVHPLQASRYRRPTVAKLVNMCVWLLALLVVLPIVFFSDASVSCGRRRVAGFAVYVFVMGFLVPVLTICLCYALILIQLRGVALRVGQHRESERKITVLVAAAAAAVFVVCWMPFHVVQLVGVFLQRYDPTLCRLVMVLGYTSSCANPLLYGVLSDSFRHSFQRILCLRWTEASEDPLDYLDYCGTAPKSRRFSLDQDQQEDPGPVLSFLTLTPGHTERHEL